MSGPVGTTCDVVVVSDGSLVVVEGVVVVVVVVLVVVTAGSVTETMTVSLAEYPPMLKTVKVYS